MFVDPEHDQDELGGDAREDHADDDAEQAADQQHETRARADRHHADRRENARDAEQHGDADREPIKNLDDRRRDEAFPLEQIAEAEHRVSPRQFTVGKCDS